MIQGGEQRMADIVSGLPPGMARLLNRPVSVPIAEWPIWAKALKSLASPQDKGIGDVIARTIGVETSEAFKAWHVKVFGKPCGCDGRQERLNRQYPLP